MTAPELAAALARVNAETVQATNTPAPAALLSVRRGLIERMRR